MFSRLETIVYGMLKKIKFATIRRIAVYVEKAGLASRQQTSALVAGTVAIGRSAGRIASATMFHRKRDIGTHAVTSHAFSAVVSFLWTLKNAELTVG